MSEFLNAVEQQLRERGHEAIRDAAGITTAVTVNGVFTEMRFKDINGQMAVCTLELCGLNIEPDQERAMVELASLVNNGMVFATATYDPDESSLGTRVSVPILTGINMVNVVELLFVNAGASAKILMAMAAPVLAGLMTPSQSITYGKGDPTEYLRRALEE